MDIRIQVMRAGEVCVAPALPFGGENTSRLAAAGVFVRQDDRLWLPVFCYLIEHPRGFVLVDTGWDRSMCPEGRFDKKAQIASLGSQLLYHVNQGVVDPGQTVAEQLAARGMSPEDLSYVLLTHLDCDHANGLKSLKGAKHVLVSADEYASVHKNRIARTRYQNIWWEGMKLEPFDWTGSQGPFGKSYDVFGDGTVVCIAIPGHSDGLFAVKVTGDDGRFVLLCSDGAYGKRSWQDMVLPGIANDRDQQRRSLEWIHEQSENPQCVEVLASHDKEVEPHTVELLGLRVPEPRPKREPEPDFDDITDDLKQNAGKVAVAAMLAATLSSTPTSFDDFPLPDAAPIVQLYDTGGGDLPPATVADDQEDESKQSIWEKIFKILKYALIALIFVASFVVASINGCTSCAGQLGLPFVSGTQSESSASAQAEG